MHKEYKKSIISLGYDAEICRKFFSFDFVRDLVVNDEDEEEIDFETLGIENSNENDENEINEKDEETVALDDPITNEIKEVPVQLLIGL